ncbi:MAG: hypothetical protein EXS36_19550 [Pedosphaera sp.]|nr:hypothetical protein [Pedosphaera sp.]
MKRIAAISALVLTTLCSVLSVRADEPKYHDSDLVYHEAKVPPYDLPPLLVSSEGKPITTSEEWFNVRRPQVMALFGNLIYGIVPAPESPIRTMFEVVNANREFMNGRATRKDVRIRFENAKGSAEMLILVFTPNGGGKPVPAFLLHSFGNRTVSKIRNQSLAYNTLRRGVAASQSSRSAKLERSHRSSFTEC